MELDIEKIRRFLKKKGWNEVTFARRLGLDYSYVYRLLRKKRVGGKKLLVAIIRLFDQENLDFRKFVNLSPNNSQK